MSDAEMNQTPQNETTGNPQQPASPGAQLAAHRQERGWTVEQVAAYLNLAPRQVAALERDDYPALPGIVITRGFIRAYAKLLRIDAAPLLAAVGGDTVLAQPLAPAKTLSMPFSESRLPSMADKPGIPFRWAVAALLLILGAVALWASQRDWELVGLPAGETQPAQQTPSPPAASAPETAPAAAAAPAQPEVAPSAPAAEPAPAGAAKPEAAKTEAAHPPAGKDALVLQAREDAWIEVRREGAKDALASRLMKAGEAESFPVDQPLQVVIGNAAGVDATLRGQSLELKGKTNTNVARLTVK